MPDIPEYIKLSKQRALLKQKLEKAIGRDLQSLIKEFEQHIEKIFKGSSNTLLLTSADFKKTVERFMNEITSRTQFQLNNSRDSLIQLHDEIKTALEFTYPIDYQLFPKIVKPSAPLLREVSSLLIKYRAGKLTEQSTLRIIKKRFRVPVSYADSYINTQLAGFDNSAAKTIADLAGLKKAMYFGPIGKHTRPFCISLLQRGGIYSAQQIRAMSNGQGLPVLRYCGGYRCMHEWIWVDEAWKLHT
jgi:hypothetical protein